MRPAVNPASPLLPLLRLLDASFPLGQAFGTRVRVFGAPLIVLLLVVPNLSLFSALSWGDSLLYALLSLTALYGTVYLHEMGHVAAGWRWSIHTPLITLSPLGGLAHMSFAPPSPKAEMLISAAGPATHLVLLALVYPLHRLVGAEFLSWSAAEPHRLRLEAVPFLLDALLRLQLGLLLFNLLPLYPLDGGRILRAALATRMHPNRATLLAARIGLAGAVLLGAYGLFGASGLYGGMLLLIAISSGMACWQAILLARHTEGPYGAPREPWEADAEAWKLGGEGPNAEPAAPPEPVRRRARAPGPDELDRLLDRVREVGLSGLSETERTALTRASEARRRGR